MVKVKKDLTNQKFGHWTVLYQAEDFINPNGRHVPAWMCQCDCENKTIRPVRQTGLVKGTSKSCGCAQKEKVSIIAKQYNKYDLSNEYGIGYTNKGEEFWFDLEDYDKIKDYCWRINYDGYVVSRKLKSDGEVFLHNIIMEFIPSNNNVIDHIDHNKINNKKNNLRIVTQQQNSFNRRMSKPNSSGITGVVWHKKDKKWQASIGYNGKHIYLGQFDDLNEAAKVRKEAEIKYFGEYRNKDNEEDNI